jgi:hypothetical protein
MDESFRLVNQNYQTIKDKNKYTMKK